MEVAAGLQPEETSDRLLAHAARCSRCGGSFRAAMRILSLEAAPAEDAVVAALKSSQQEWQFRVGKTLAARAQRRASPWLQRGMWLAAAASLVATAGLYLYWRDPSPPLRMLAEAYTAHRTVELRITGAGYAPLRLDRGGARVADRPAGLLESEASIVRRLEAHPLDVPWLLAKGRAGLLEWDYERAIAALELARNLIGSSQSALRTQLLVDEATAYFERAEAEGRAIDLSKSADLLGAAIQADGSQPMAYFNRAIVLEKMMLYDSARQDWERYLQLDQSGPWHDEAQRRLSALTIKLHGALDGSASDLAEVGLESAMRGELDAAVAGALASRLKSEHGDAWLLEIEAAPPEGSAELQEMARSRTAMRVEEFPRELDKLDTLRGRQRTEAGRAWVEFERLFRIAHSPAISGCAASLDRPPAVLHQRRYFWLLAQTLLDRSTCQMAGAHLEAAQASVQDAMAVTSSHGFPVAGLRAAGFWSNRLAMAGQYREAAEVERNSLGLFWSRPFPVERAQQFYNDMCWVDEGLERWHAASAAAGMAASIAHRAGWVLTEAVNRARGAGFAEKTGMRLEAAEEYRRANALFQTVRDSSSAQEYRAYAEAQGAALDHNRGELARWSEIVRASKNPIVAVPYLRAMAAWEAQSGHSEQALTDLRDAVTRIEGQGDPAAGAAQLRLWRMELDGAYRDLVSLELQGKRLGAAYRDWQTFLRLDARMRGPAIARTSAEGEPATLVTFARLAGHYAIWVNEDGEIRFLWSSKPAEEIDFAVRRFTALCSQPGAPEAVVKELGASIRSELLERAAALPARDRPMLIQPDGALAALPWAALPLRSGAALGEAARLAIVPLFAPAEGRAALRRVAIHKGLLIAATATDAQYASEFPPLPDVEGEVAAVRQSLPFSTLLAGADATAARIEQHWDGADVFHFAGHAWAAANGIRLLVAPDASSNDSERARGLWKPRTDARRDLSLAVLSACSTARYEEADSLEPDHLAAAFLTAGAQQVVATLWDSDSGASRKFMTAFYAALRAGGGAAAAMREGRRAVRATPGWEDPYYWAPFVFFVQA
jgi:tetratricopeptide (TPR) repeat protein